MYQIYISHFALIFDNVPLMLKTIIIVPKYVVCYNNETPMKCNMVFDFAPSLNNYKEYVRHCIVV